MQSNGHDNAASVQPPIVDGTGPLPLDSLLTLMRSRRSIRRYQARQVEPSLLEALLEAAMWAPSAHNRQPWRFAVLEPGAAKARLVDDMAARWRSDLAADGQPAEFIERRVALSSERMTGAPLLVVAALTMAQMDAYTDARRAAAERMMAVQSVALACQNLLLAAHAAGLGGCWMCAPLFVPEVVQQALDLPTDWEPQALLTLGYPAEEKVKEREPLQSRVLWR